MSGTRPLWLATLGWGADPWWDVTGRTARRRARRRLLDLALIVAVLAAFASTSGAGARIAGAAAESEARSPATAAVDVSTARGAGGAVDVVPAAQSADAELGRPSASDPVGAPNLTPWAVVLVAMVFVLAVTVRTRNRPLR